MIALRKEASGSIAKVVNADGDIFRLYAANNMSIAVQPESVKTVPLGFVPSKSGSGYTLSVSRVESMDTEAVWLEDKKTGQWLNLRETAEYTFNTGEGDAPDRFTVHFAEETITGTHNPNSSLSLYYADGEIRIRGLSPEDAGAPIRVTGLQGKTVIAGAVNTCPEQRLRVSLPAGVYLATVGGQRNKTIKIIVKGGMK